MKNNTKIRLHLSKQLFESLTKQIVAEGKMKHNLGAGMEEVKKPKAKKAKMEEMETRVAEAPKSMEEMSLPEPIQQLFSDPDTAQAFGASVLKLLGTGTTLAVAITQGMKALAKKAIDKNPKAFVGKTVDQVAQEMGGAMTGKVQKTAGGSGEGGLLGK